MTAIDLLQLVAVLGSLAFVAYQSWLMRKALQEQRNEAKVQSYLQVWMNHIQTCHIPVATADEKTAEALNGMSPYRGVKLPEARRCHFADAILDFYECIQLLAETGILDDEAVRVWKDSVPYEMRNPDLRAHWRRYHHSGESEQLPNIGALGVYHRNFLRYVEDCILKADTMEQKHSPDSVSRKANVR